MSVLLILAIVIVVLLVVMLARRNGAASQQTQLEDARADAQRWYERLGGQLMNLHGDDAAARQALSDASERYNAAGGQLQQASSVKQFELARESALEGLNYVRAARMAMGIDPGPELPPLASAQGAGRLTQEREVNVQGQHYKAGPTPGADTPYYYPGGRVQGRPVPAGWYSTPVWKTALGAGAGVLGGMLIFDALFSPGFGDMGYGDGYQDGFQDAAGDFNGGDNMGDFSGNDMGGGDWGGGDVGGGDFGGDF
jgi:type II secretory pathway pseudopilin PulG